MRTYHVYILASRSRRLYIGITGDLVKRLHQHHTGKDVTTAKYRMTRLVLVETTSDVRSAIRREKQLKGWTRAKKLTLINHANPAWDDLSSTLRW